VKLFAILAPLALMVACSKAPAEAALRSAEQAVDAARPVAEKLVPDQMKSLTDALAGAKDKFGKGDYAGTIEAAKDIPAKANEVVAAAKAKKDELTKAWEDLTKDVTSSVGAITARVGELMAMKKLPKAWTRRRWTARRRLSTASRLRGARRPRPLRPATGARPSSKAVR